MRVHPRRSMLRLAFLDGVAVLAMGMVGCVSTPAPDTLLNTGGESGKTGGSGGKGGSGGAAGSSTQKTGTGGAAGGTTMKIGTGGTTGDISKGGATGTAGAPGAGGTIAGPIDAPIEAGPDTGGAVDIGGPPPSGSGWANCVPIFDGKTFDGWEETGKWEIKDGAIATKPAAGRGQIGTVKSYKDFRLIFSVRHRAGGHNPCTLIWGRKHNGGDAFGGAYQLQAPTPFGWNYVNNGDLNLKKAAGAPTINTKQWAQCEILARDTGKVRMACCQQDEAGTQPCKGVQMIEPYTNAGAPFLGPLGFQIHGEADILDDYKNICVEENPKVDDFITAQ